MMRTVRRVRLWLWGNFMRMSLPKMLLVLLLNAAIIWGIIYHSEKDPIPERWQHPMER